MAVGRDEISIDEKMKKRVVLRADASKSIGYGHFTRTLALANILREHFICFFATYKPSTYQLNEITNVCSYLPLEGNDILQYNSAFLSSLNTDDIVVLDNYFFDTNFQKTIKLKGCKLVCIDDIHTRHFYCDVLFCPDPCSIDSYSLETFTRFYGGLEWAFLRKPFLENRYTRPACNEIKNIILGIGGADPYNLTDRLINLLLDKSLNVMVLAGDTVHISKKHYKYIDRYIKASAQEIVQLFNKADLGIFSASTICNEALAVELPIAAGYYVDNQVEIYHELVKSGRALPLDDFSDERLKQRLDQVLHLPAPATWKKGNIRKHYIELFHTLCFKNYRIGTFHFIDYRNLSEAQHLEVWQARTDSRICCWMSNQTIFSFESHLDFVNSLRSFSDRFFWAVYKDNCFLGSVNIHVMDSGYAERGIFMNPCLVGKAMAKEIEENAYSIYRNLGISVLKAKVRKNNIRSLKYHQKTGYSIECENEEYYFLIKILNEL